VLVTNNAGVWVLCVVGGGLAIAALVAMFTCPVPVGTVLLGGAILTLIPVRRMQGRGHR